MYYFISFSVLVHAYVGDQWMSAQAVINRHPFNFIKDQGSPMYAVLHSFQAITEEEYELYSSLFKTT